jgi:hypothetical protein
VVKKINGGGNMKPLVKKDTFATKMLGKTFKLGDKHGVKVR